MKRAIPDGKPMGGRGKQARGNGAGAMVGAGSQTTTHHHSVLSLQPLVAQGDVNPMDTAMDEADEEMYSDGDEDEDESESSGDDESHEGGLPTIDSLIKALDAKKLGHRTRALKELLNRLSELSKEDALGVLIAARKKLYTESSKSAKVLLIHVVQATLEITDADGRGPVEDLLNQLQADSTEVRVQVYDTISYILKIGRLPGHSLSDINTIRGLLTTAIAGLKDRHHRIRSAVLQLISQLAPVLRAVKVTKSPSSLSSKAGYSQHDIQIIISNYVNDPEPRVRMNALKALLDLHHQGFKLGLLMYDVAILGLGDDYQEVRLHSLELVFILSGIYPNQTVQNPQATALQAMRLVDDAFKAKLIATPEGDQDVTAEHVKLLDSGACGAFVHGLEDEFQEVRNAAITSICELCLHNPEFSLLAVDYLVDMFMDDIDHVRLNALTSLCKIANKVPITFDTEQLQIALGVLEDADSNVREATHRLIESVTMATQDGMVSFLASIESNTKRFPEDQLSIYVCIRAVGRRHGPFVGSMVAEMLHLDKMFLPIEENVEDMLYGGHLILIFNAAIPNPSILNELPKYAFKHYTYLRDKYPNCFPEPSEIPCPGTQPLRDLAESLTMTIVHADPNDTEMDSTASRQRHARRQMPPNSGVTSAYERTIAAMRVQTEVDAENFYENVLQNMDRVHILARQRGANYRAILRNQITTCKRDLYYITNVHARQARAAEFLIMYLDSYDLLVQIQDTCHLPSFIVMAPILSAQLFRLSYYMDHGFLGLDPTARVSVGHFRVVANLVWFFGMVQKKSDREGSKAGLGDVNETKGYLKTMLQQAIKRVSNLQLQMDQPEVDQERIQKHRALLGDMRVALVRAFQTPTTTEIIKLMSSIVKFVPMELDLRHLTLQRITADIRRPVMNRDVPLDVHPSFPFMVPVEGVIRNVRDTQGIAVQVTFPGNVIRYYYPPSDHFTQMEDDAERLMDDDDMDGDGCDDPASPTFTFRLRTSIEIFPDAAWGTGTPTDLRFTLTRAFQPDLVEHDEFICRFAEEITFQNRQQEQQTRPQSNGNDIYGERGTLAAAQNVTGASNSMVATLSDAASSLLGRMGYSTSSSTVQNQQNQSTLEISKSVTYYVSRRAPFEGLGTTL
ncbi:Integrator complex subunit 4 [Podila epigama]|nr:Integrator complex subunit 4 [Podila epigama]